MSVMWFSMLCKLFVVTTLHRAFIRKLVLALCHNRKWCHPGPRLKVLYPASSQVIKIQLYRKVLSACRSTRLFAHPHLPVSHDLHLTLPAHCIIYVIYIYIIPVIVSTTHSQLLQVLCVVDSRTFSAAYLLFTTSFHLFDTLISTTTNQPPFLITTLKRAVPS